MTGKKQTSFLGNFQREDFEDLEELFTGVESFMGYLPNAHILMAQNPSLLIAFSEFARTIFQSEYLNLELKQLIALASSLSSGCKYCQAHTSHGAERAGVEVKKIADILNYENSNAYDDKERAILDLAFAAGKNPNQSTKKHFEKLKKYCSEKEIVEVVSVISLFGYLNRWNDTFGTLLENVPGTFVETELIPLGWT